MEQQTVNNAVPEKEQSENQTQRAATPLPTPLPSQKDLKMGGNFSRYMSKFWQIVLPFLGVRALFEEANKLFKFNDRVRKNGLIFGKFEDKGLLRWATLNIMTLGFGALLSGITAYYTDRTYKDIKTLFAEAVGYELGKPASEVRFGDMKRSQNVIVKTTMHALINRTMKRFGAVATVFFPWGYAFNHKNYPDKGKTDQDNFGIKMGAGVVAAYLFTDGFLRKESLFEAMQDRLGDTNTIITPADIESFLNLDKRSENKDYVPALPGTEAATQQVQLATLIADRMNHTYKVNPPDARLTVGKLVYMLGFDMLDKYPESLGYVELASKSSDMQEVKQVAAAIKNGMNPAAVFREYGIALESAMAANPMQGGLAEPTAGKYANLVGQPQAKVPQMARTPQDFATVPENTTPHLGI